jgi:O-antigen/teichoic acid export membrane protein
LATPTPQAPDPAVAPLPSALGAARGLVGNAVVYGLGSLLLKGIPLLLMPVVTRAVAPEDYGRAAAATSAAALLGILFPLSLHASYARLHHDASGEEERGETLWTLWLALLASSVLLALLLEIVGPFLAGAFFRDLPFHPYLRLALWTSFAGVFALLPQAFLQVRERPVPYVLVSSLGAIVSAGAVLVLVVALHRGARGYLEALFLGSTAVAGPFAWLTLRRCRFRFRTDHLRKALSYSLPLVPHGVGGWLLALSDRVILERSRPLDDLGIYWVAVQVAGALTLVAVAANTAWSAFLFRIHASHGDGAKGILTAQVTWFTVGATGLALGLGLFARPLVTLLAGEGYREGAALVPWLALSGLLGSLYSIPANFLFLTSRTGWIPAGTVTAGLLNVGLNLWLVPRHGLAAAAGASVAANAALLLLMWAAARRIFPFPYEYRRLAHLAAVAGLLGAAAFLLPWDGAWARAALFALFPALLAVTGFLTAGERSRLGRLRARGERPA